MKVRELHPWTVSQKEAIHIQERLKERLSFEHLPDKVRSVAGADVAYSNPDKSLCAGVVLLEIPEFRVLWKRWIIEPCSFPYRTGLLAFREGPALLKAISSLPVIPDVIVFDGHGTYHPRGIGLASHLGLILEIPSVGCAKSPLICHRADVGIEPGSLSWIQVNGNRVGAILRTRKGVKPVYVSPGHLITLEEAVEVVLQASRGYRIPEPIRLAHILANSLTS